MKNAGKSGGATPVTLSVIKADIGGYVGHSASHPDILERARALLDHARTEGKLIDFHVTACGDDLELFMTHRHGNDSRLIHKLAWDVFLDGTALAKDLKLYGAGQDMLADAFSGNVKGMGPGVAEMTFVERKSEPVIIFCGDKCAPGAWNLPLFRIFADPFNTIGLVIDPSMHDGFRFEVHDLHKGSDIVLSCPEEMYDLLVLIGSPENYIIKNVYKKDADIMAAILHTGLPIAYVTVFDGSDPYAVAGPPAAVAKTVAETRWPAAWATYEVISQGITQLEYRIYATLFTELGPNRTDTLDRQHQFECRRPSVAITPGDIVHVAWQRDNNTTGSNIYYKQFTGLWTPEWPVSNNMPTAHNPFVQVYGDSVFVEFSSPANPGDIRVRPRCVNHPYNDWRDIRDVSNTPADHSDRPAMSTREVSVWQETVAGEGEVFINIAGEVADVSGTISSSAYPSVDATINPETGQIKASIVWTEEIDPLVPLYEVKFAERNWLPHDGAASGAPAFYAVTTGESVPSPYCRYRSGAVRVGPYDLDFGRDSLAYSLPFLDPSYDYYLRAIVYHEGQGRWSQGIRFQDTLSKVVGFEPGKPETIWVQVPPRTYLRDAVADLAALRYNGEYSVMTDFALYQAEPSRGSKGGEEGGEMSLTVPLRATLIPPAPNPFVRSVLLGFVLNRPGNVSLRIYDASGRVARTLAAGEHPAGRHLVRWDGCDAKGRTLSSGIYMAKLTSEAGSEVRKLVLTR
jgi:hypothetical protein